MDISTFAAGCFWAVEERFRIVKGVTLTRVGYTGGKTNDPNYQQVCTGTTGHAEALEFNFEPDLISFKNLLNIFWHMHDPITLNRQGADIGTQYRSAIFYHNEEQYEQALTAKQTLDNSNTFANAIVTEITAAHTFYPAEEYHQCYLEKRRHGSPSLNITH